ncbi:hypothetical protein [Pseudomonas putida]|nr:hypothetical protein [Pseudomonas putida]
MTFQHRQRQRELGCTVEQAAQQRLTFFALLVALDHQTLQFDTQQASQ